MRSSTSSKAAGADARANTPGSITVLPTQGGRVSVRPMTATVDQMCRTHNPPRTRQAAWCGSASNAIRAAGAIRGTQGRRTSAPRPKRSRSLTSWRTCSSLRPVRRAISWVDSSSSTPSSTCSTVAWCASDGGAAHVDELEELAGHGADARSAPFMSVRSARADRTGRSSCPRRRRRRRRARRTDRSSVQALVTMMCEAGEASCHTENCSTASPSGRRKSVSTSSGRRRRTRSVPSERVAHGLHGNRAVGLHQLAHGGCEIGMILDHDHRRQAGASTRSFTPPRSRPMPTSHRDGHDEHVCAGGRQEPSRTSPNIRRRPVHEVLLDRGALVHRDPQHRRGLVHLDVDDPRVVDLTVQVALGQHPLRDTMSRTRRSPAEGHRPPSGRRRAPAGRRD